MPATHAWPPQSTPRLFVETALSQGVQLRVEGSQAHYLIAVMRMKPGDPV
ncbi:MAG: 16S rRNA (uracil(1498)-N(3))-methyltransferase, partial [Sphingomonas bacterium]